MTAPQVPAWLLDTQPPRDMNADLKGGLGVAIPPYISIEDNRFTYVDAAGESEGAETYDKKVGPYIDVVIVDANKNKSQVYYENEYVPGAKSFKPPDCWSDNGIAPSKDAASPQWPTCSTCPKAEWGSATSKVTGKGVPACRRMKKLAVFPVDRPNMLFQLRVPPNSQQGKPTRMREYVEMIGAQRIGDRKLTVSDVVTRVYFESQGTLAFYPTGFISKEHAEARKKVWDADAGAIMVGRNDEPIDEATQKALAAKADMVGTLGVSRVAEQRALPQGQQALQQGQQALQQGQQALQQGQQAANAQTLSQRALAARNDSSTPPARGPGRPPKAKTVAPAPKAALAAPDRLQSDNADGLDIPDYLRRTQPVDDADRDYVAAESDEEAREAAASFGVAQNVEDPPEDIEAQLGGIFGKVPGT